MAWVQEEKKQDGTTGYRARWWTVDASGNKRKQQSELLPTRQDADEECRKVESARYRGLAMDYEAAKQPLSAYAPNWLRTRVQPKDGKPLRPKTVEGYEKLLRLYLYPAFGNTPLRQINTPAVRRWYVESLERQPLQTRKAYRLLHAIMTTAHQDNLIAQVPYIPGAGQEHHRERAIPADDVVIALADDIHPRLRAAVLLCAYGALRPPSEIRGLQRRDIDVQSRTVSVTRSITSVVGAGVVVDDPKTSAGKRTVAMPAFVVNALVDHMARFTGPGPDAWVFSNPAGGQLHNPFFYGEFRASCQRLGLPDTFKPYDLRHYAATKAAEVPGMTIKNLMARIGHASHVAALIYQHRSERVDRTASDYMEGIYADAVVRQSGEEGKVIRLRRPS